MSAERRLRLEADVRRVCGEVVGQETSREGPALISGGASREVRQRRKQNALMVSDTRSFKALDRSSFAYVDVDPSETLRDRNPLLCVLVHVDEPSHASALSHGPAPDRRSLVSQPW